MYRQLEAPGKNWHPIEPENLSPAGNGSNTDPNRDFRLLYQPPLVPGRHEFIPLFVDPMHEEDQAGNEALQQESPANASAGADSHGAGTDLEPDLKSDPEAIRDSAYQEGFSEGEKAGFEAGERNAGKMVERIQSLLHEMEAGWDRLVSNYEEKILQLVFRVSERVACGSAAVDPEAAKRVILDAFRTIPEPVEVTIDVHPEDAEYIERVKEAFFDANKGLKTISLVPDPSVGRGGCRLKTRFGEVDATLETRLDAVRQTVMNAYRSKGDNGCRG